MNKNIKILVVDDIASMRNFIIDILTDLGFNNIDEAMNGQEAWDKLQCDDINLLLTDWNMPVVNGLDLIKRVRSETKFNNLKIIMISSNSTKFHIESAEQAGVNRYITKPFTTKDLDRSLQALLT